MARIADAIEGGEIRPGHRLPSVRALSKRLHVSIGTVLRAYEEAFERGLIGGKAGRGRYVRRRAPYEQLSVVDRSRIPAGCLDLYQNLPVEVPEVERRAWADTLATLQRRVDLAALARASWSEVHERSQEAGAAWIRRVGLEAPPAQIVEGPGTQAVLTAAATAVLRPGDGLLAPSLSHPWVKLVAEQYQWRLRPVPLDEDGIVPAALEEACREHPQRALYVAPTIHSPTTITMSATRRREIAEIAVRHELAILEDESSAFLFAEPPPPIASFAPQHTFFVADLWMALSLGLRTTYVLVPEPHKQAMSTAVAATCGVTAPLMREIAARWIESDVAERLIAARVAELAARHALTREILGRRRVRADPRGHHVWIELDAPWRADLFVARAEQRGVAVVGADWFHIGHEPRPEGVRVCIGNAPDREALRWGLSVLDGLMDEEPSSVRPAI